MNLADQGAVCPPYHLCKEDFLQTLFSPAHMLSEVIFAIVIDLVLVTLIYGQMIKPYVKRKLDAAHAELDAEHGVDHAKSTSPVLVCKRPTCLHSLYAHANDQDDADECFKCDCPKYVWKDEELND